MQIDQNKEKWNTLSIYHSAAGTDQDKLEDIALDIEAQSASLCEICGSNFDRTKGCCLSGSSDIKAINERMLMLIEGKSFH